MHTLDLVTRRRGGELKPRGHEVIGTRATRASARQAVPHGSCVDHWASSAHRERPAK